MASNKKTGDWGEDYAVRYLIGKGFIVIDRNYRWSRSEIDVIARDGNELVFVEVKTRSGVNFGFPEEWVDSKKVERILLAAEDYVHVNNWKGKIRFDIIAIIRNHPIELKHFRDAFY